MNKNNTENSPSTLKQLVFKKSSATRRTPPQNNSDPELSDNEDPELANQIKNLTHQTLTRNKRKLLDQLTSTKSRSNSTDSTTESPTPTDVETPTHNTNHHTEVHKPITEIKIEPTSPEPSIELESANISNPEPAPTQHEEDTNQIDQTPTENQPSPNTTMAQQTAMDVFNMVQSLPSFSGNDSQNTIRDLRQFIANAEMSRTHAISETNKPIFDQFIKSKLIGDAFTKTQTKTITDFNNLKETLHRIYATNQSLEELRQNFCNCQQTSTENINEFGQKLTKTFEEYISGFEAKYKEKHNAATLRELNDQAMLTFKKGLRNTQLRREIATTTKDTLEELIREATTREKLLLDTGIYDMPQNYNPLPPAREKIKCHYCGIPNHVMRECQKYKMDQQRSSNTNQNYSAQQPRISPKSNNTTQLHQFPARQNPNPQWHQQQMATRPQQHRFQPTPFYRNTQPEKFCSYCKINGHEIHECRNKRRHESNLLKTSPPRTTPSNYRQDLPDIWHARNSTPHRQQEQRQWYQHNQNTSNSSQQKRCTFCGLYGHLTEECRRRQTTPKPYNDQQKDNSLESEMNKLKIFTLNNETENSENYNGSATDM